jgi:hypothetical protein
LLALGFVVGFAVELLLGRGFTVGDGVGFGGGEVVAFGTAKVSGQPLRTATIAARSAAVTVRR